MAAVYAAVPWALGLEKHIPFTQRYWVKINAWIVILSYVGNFHWTIYFYNLLGAKYTFDAHRFNDVPIAMFLATHAYFCFYHTLMNLLIRRIRNAILPFSTTKKFIINVIVIACLAYITAFMETKTIEGFPYWEFQNRERALTFGSCMYMLYFVVSFPAHLSIDEVVDASHPKRSIGQVCWHSLGACMLVTILLEQWRLFIGQV